MIYEGLIAHRVYVSGEMVGFVGEGYYTTYTESVVMIELCLFLASFPTITPLLLRSEYTAFLFFPFMLSGLSQL